MPDKSGPKKCSRRKWMSRFVKLRCNALLSAVKSCAMTIERWSVECNPRAWKISEVLSQLKIGPKKARDLFRLHIMEFNSNNFSTTKRQRLNVGCKRTDWGDRSQYNWNILSNEVLNLRHSRVQPFTPIWESRSEIHDFSPGAHDDQPRYHSIGLGWSRMVDKQIPIILANNIRPRPRPRASK